MSHTLISFLGKSQRTDGRYRTATYDFGEGVTRTTSFFSMGLKEVINPDKLIILGTSGSMWDVLCGELSQDENDLEALMAAVDTNTVTVQMGRCKYFKQWLRMLSRVSKSL